MKCLQIFSISLLLLSNVLFNNAFGMKKVFNKNIFSKNRFFRSPTRWILTEKENEEFKKLTMLDAQINRAEEEDNAELLHESISQFDKKLDDKTCRSAISKAAKSRCFIHSIVASPFVGLLFNNFDYIVDGGLSTYIPCTLAMVCMPAWIMANVHIILQKEESVISLMRKALGRKIDTFNLKKFKGTSPLEDKLNVLNIKIKEQKEEKKK